MVKKCAYFKGFTLAEVMIVLTVIGVLTAILLPVARQSMPDKDLMKFKKAHNTLGTVIRELVTSDKYYLDGDLGVKPDGSLVESPTYFCETIADILNVKENNCPESDITYSALDHKALFDIRGEELYSIDDDCKNSTTITEQIILNDDVVFYETMPSYHFNIEWNHDDNETTLFRNGDHTDDNGFNPIYKNFCIDIDGINQGEDPFGYGIRADGKIVAGARADEWLARDVNEE